LPAQNPIEWELVAHLFTPFCFFCHRKPLEEDGIVAVPIGESGMMARNEVGQKTPRAFALLSDGMYGAGVEWSSRLPLPSMWGAKLLRQFVQFKLSDPQTGFGCTK